MYLGIFIFRKAPLPRLGSPFLQIKLALHVAKETLQQFSIPLKNVLYVPKHAGLVGTLAAWEKRSGASCYNFKIPTSILPITTGILLTCRACFPPSSGHRRDLCMMCIMEGHINDALRSSDSAIQPWAVVRVLTRKSFQLLLQAGVFFGFFPILGGGNY